MPDLAGVRQELAAAQARLVAALVADGPRPPGFDAERLRIQASSLISKRRGGVARALSTMAPGVLADLGPDFTAEFAAYAKGRPKPAGGSRADAQAFLAWVHAKS
ncbi:hypothetical protein J5X84_40005 [Streptosporangiaceae bacterium NEAU-GS5]|nr:hypothetical protein [Streptosporangiaceae bacterium NEAU-GS5]